MSSAARPKKTRSPRAPSMSLDEAIEKIARVYEREHRHAAPIDAVAQSLGYSGANNGAALTALASLRYYGLLERPAEGQAQVSKDFEAYNFAPDDALRHSLLVKWLKAPPIFAELLEKFPGELPSDPTLKFALIQRGFSPPAADDCVSVFRRSVDFSGYYEEAPAAGETLAEPDAQPSTTSSNSASSLSQISSERRSGPAESRVVSADVDRIPVRLAGARRAWIEIPSPFYAADKDRLKAQIDLLLTDDEVEGDEDL